MIPDLWPRAYMLSRYRKGMNESERCEAIRAVRHECDATLARIGELMALLQKLGAEVWMNYEPNLDGTHGDISIGCKIGAPPVMTAQDLPGATTH